MYACVRVHAAASHLMDHERGRGRGRACLTRRRCFYVLIVGL